MAHFDFGNYDIIYSHAKTKDEKMRRALRGDDGGA